MSKRTILVVGSVLSLSPAVAPAVPVTVNFKSTIQTVAGSPFGFTDAVRLQPVNGSFTYETGTPDTDPFDDPDRGIYDHLAGGAFVATLPDGRVIRGSAVPEAQVENFNPDTFRFRDGLLNMQGTMTIDNVPSPTAALSLSITDASGAAFADDGLPAAFPLTGSSPYPYPHTFGLSDGFGNTLLMQFTEVSAVPEPGTAGAVATAAASLLAARRRRPILPG